MAITPLLLVHNAVHRGSLLIDMRHRVLGGVLLLIWRKTLFIVQRGIPSFLDESRLRAESERQSDTTLRVRNGGRLAKSGGRFLGGKEIELGGHSSEV